MAATRNVLAYTVVSTMAIFLSAQTTYMYNSRGAETYSLSKSKCCGLKVIDIPEDGSTYDYDCCDDHQTGSSLLYDKRTNVCCNGTLIDKGGFNDIFCCGAEVYRYSKSKCCGLKVIDIPEDGITYSCCDDHHEGSSVLYDGRTHVCCDGTLIDKGGFSDMYCCGVEAYSYSKSKCCGLKVIDIPEGDRTNDYECCNDHQAGSSVLYDRRTHVCCSGALVPKPEPGYHYYSCCYDHQTESSVLYDHLTSVCCGNKVADQGMGEYCCGGEIYNNRTQLCCEHSEYSDTGSTKKTLVQELTSKYTTCCGLDTYDVRTQVCCEDVVLQKEEGMADDCCGGEPFYPATQLCCMTWGEETIKNGSGSSAPDSCCETAEYDTNNEFCCGEDYFWLWINDTMVEVELHKVTIKTCCNGQLMPLHMYGTCPSEGTPSRYNVKCGDREFNFHTQGCCGNKEPYDKSTHTCCQGVVQAFTQEAMENQHDACCAATLPVEQL